RFWEMGLEQPSPAQPDLSVPICAKRQMKGIAPLHSIRRPVRNCDFDAEKTDGFSAAFRIRQANSFGKRSIPAPFWGWPMFLPDPQFTCSTHAEGPTLFSKVEQRTWLVAGHHEHQA